MYIRDMIRTGLSFKNSVYKQTSVVEQGARASPEEIQGGI